VPVPGVRPRSASARSLAVVVDHEPSHRADASVLDLGVSQSDCLKSPRSQSAKMERTRSRFEDGTPKVRLLRDTERTMPEKSRTPDPVELTRRMFEAAMARFSDTVVLTIKTLAGRLAGGREPIQPADAYVFNIEAGRDVRWTTYQDIDNARAAAERLAAERG
jgi:hypothetical protein